MHSNRRVAPKHAIDSGQGKIIGGAAVLAKEPHDSISQIGVISAAELDHSFHVNVYCGAGFCDVDCQFHEIPCKQGRRTSLRHRNRKQKCMRN